jgi:hypothetical protein
MILPAAPDDKGISLGDLLKTKLKPRYQAHDAGRQVLPMTQEPLSDAGRLAFETAKNRAACAVLLLRVLLGFGAGPFGVHTQLLSRKTIMLTASCRMLRITTV